MKADVRRREIVNCIEDFTAFYRYPPTVRDIQGKLGIKSTATVFQDLQFLANEGLIGRIGSRFVPNYTDSYLEAIKRYAKSDG